MTRPPGTAPDGPAIPARWPHGPATGGAACRFHRSTCTPTPGGTGVHVDFTTINTRTSTDLAITRSYRTRFIPEHGFSVYFPAPFKTVHEYRYGPDGRLNPDPDSR